MKRTGGSTLSGTPVRGTGKQVSEGASPLPGGAGAVASRRRRRTLQKKLDSSIGKEKHERTNGNFNIYLSLYARTALAAGQFRMCRLRFRLCPASSSAKKHRLY